MPTIEPTKDVPLPYTEAPDKPSDFIEALETTADTLEALEELGAPIEVDAEDAFKTAELLKAAIKKRDLKPINNTPAVAFGAKEFIRTYSARLAVEISDVRTALTNKLLELANCGDPRYELKALELLGKHSDIALFTERSEVTVNYKNSTDLEGAIKDRIRRILHSAAVDVEPITPSADRLDEVFGPEKIRVSHDEIDIEMPAKPVQEGE
jgi:AAA+ ATPase superfamily predicted ATPase